MKRKGGMLLVGAMVLVGVCEIALHWLLGRGGHPRLLMTYLSAESPSGRHELAGMLDNTVPAAVLGWVNGWIGLPRWSVRKLVATTFVLAIFVAALMPAYSALIGPHLFAIVWGVPRTASQAALFHLCDFFGAFLIVGFFTYAAYVFRDWKHRAGSRSRTDARQSHK